MNENERFERLMEILLDDDEWHKYWLSNSYVGTWEYGRKKIVEYLKLVWPTIE